MIEAVTNENLIMNRIYTGDLSWDEDEFFNSFYEQKINSEEVNDNDNKTNM